MNSSVCVESEWSGEDLEDGKAIGVLTDDDDLIICSSGIENRPSNENDVHASSIGKSADSSGSLLKSIASIENLVEDDSIEIDDNLSSISSVSEYAESENSVDAFDGFQAHDAPNSPSSATDDEFEGFSLVSPECEGVTKSDAESIAVENTDCEETIFENMSEDVIDNTFEGFDPFNSISNSNKLNSVMNNKSIDSKMEVHSSHSIIKETSSKSSTSNAKTVSASPSKVKLEDDDDSDDFIGPNCQAIGCTVSWLETNSPMSKPVNVTNGIVFELSEFAKKIAWEREYVARWISRIQGVPSELTLISDEDLKKIHMVIKRRKAISVTFSGKYLLKVKLSSFDKEEFHLPSLEFAKNADASKSIPSTNGRKKINQKLSEKNSTSSEKKHFGSVLHTSVVATSHLSASVAAKNAKNYATCGSNRSNYALISRHNMEMKSATKSTYDFAKNLDSCKINNKPLTFESSKVTEMSNESSIISSKNKSSQAAYLFTCEAENVLSDGELIIDESAFSDNDSHESHNFNRGRKTSVAHSPFNEDHVNKQRSCHILENANLSKLSDHSSFLTAPSFTSINSIAVEKNLQETSTKFQECLKKSLLQENVCSDSKDPAHTQSLGTFASSPIALAVGVVNKKLDPVKIVFGQHIKFASKKGKGDFAGKNVQYPIFELRNNVIGPYCSRAELSVKMLNAPSKKILMTNGMVIELYIFFKERGATLTSLVYKIHQLTTIPLNADLIQLQMSKIQEVVNTELHKKTEYFLEREFSFISTDTGSVTHVAKIKEPSPAGSSFNLLAKKISFQNTQTNQSTFQDLNVSNEQKDCSDAATVQKPLEEEEILDVSMLLDFEKSKGKQGGITRGDIVRLYYSWLQQKNKDKDSIFVIDLLNDVEKLMISRNIDVVRIPVGTLMSSSVKLYEEYKSYRASNSEDALAYLEDDWLEDLNYLISSSKNVRSSIEESSSCKSYDRNSKERLAKSVSSCSSTKNGEKISLSISTNDTVKGRISSTENSVCLALEKVSTNSSMEETSKSKLCSMIDEDLPNKNKNAAAILRKLQLPVKRPAEVESKSDQSKSKCCKYSSEILVTDGSEIYPPLPVISSSQFTDLTFEFRIERVVSCRLSSRNGLSTHDYLIEWKGNSPIADTWVEEKDFPPGCIFIAKFWQDNSTRTINVNEIKDHKKVEDENGEEIYFLVTWQKYNSSSWIVEKHFPAHASELLCMYKKFHMQNHVPSPSLVNNDIVIAEPVATNSSKASTEVNLDDEVTQLNEQASKISVEITSGKELNSHEAEESSTGVSINSSGTSNLNKARCSMVGQASHHNGSQSTTTAELRSPTSKNVADNKKNALTAVEVARQSQSLKKDDHCMESSKENECNQQRNSAQDSCPSLIESSKNVDSKQSSAVVCPNENLVRSCSSLQFSDTTSPNTASGISRAKRKPREEFFSIEEKERTMKVLKTIPLGQVLNQNECLQFSDLVAQCMPLNTASNSTLFCGVTQMRCLTNGKLLSIYDEWRKQKANKKADKSMKSFGALRAKIKSSMESYGMDYDYDDCLLGVCYSLHFARAGLTSMADIMRFNSSPCTDALKSFKANHDSVKKKYYKNIGPDSKPTEKISKSVDRVTLNRARQTRMCYDLASNKIKCGISTVKEALSASDVESQAAVNDDLTELQQGFDFIEKKQKNLSSAIDSYVQEAKNNQAKKTLKKLGYDGDELKDLLSLVSQNVQQEVPEN